MGGNSLISSHSNLFDSDRSMLNHPILFEEVHRALFSMANYKSLGPDGFHPLFF